MGKTALEKRIKRNIIAKDHTFFASCAPGLKTLLVNEIENLNIESKKIIAIPDEIKSILDKSGFKINDSVSGKMFHIFSCHKE